MASQRGQLQTDIHYCYHCFDWVISGEWDNHCQSHLSTMTSKRRGTITYCYTLVRPAYCPDCLGEESLPASQRMESWCRDHALWTHMHHHLEKYEWPRTCPDPMCVREASLRNDTAPRFKDREDLQFHLIDEHGFSRTRPRELACSNPRQLRSQDDPASIAHENHRPNRKRTSSSRDGTFEWGPPQCFEATSISEDCLSPPRLRKRAREMTPTISPSLLSTFGDEVDDRPLQISSLETIPSSAYVFEDVDLGNADLTLESEQPGRHRIPKCDAFDPPDSASTDSHTDSDALFSRYLRSPSPSSSIGLPSEHSDETLVDRDGEDSSPNPPAKSASIQGLNHEMSQIEEKCHTNTAGLRIRLRVPPQKPRIVLHLTHPKPSIPAKRRRSKRT
jgi:hypothetical protein